MIPSSCHLEIARTCMRPAYDPKSRKLVADQYDLVESHICDYVCDLDSVMDFGLNNARFEFRH